MNPDPGHKNPGFLFAVKYLAMRIQCKTLLDCTATAVTGHFRASQIPFRDRAGQLVDTAVAWNRSRNQQRNWETLLQLVALRCQPMDIVLPQRVQDHWQFEFTVESAGVFGTEALEDLYRDCDGVPMITGLDEDPHTRSMVVISGPDRNIWFRPLNTSTEI